MTEAEWRECADPERILAWLLPSGRASERKLRLFAVACCRRVWHLFADPRCRDAVEVAERQADGRAGWGELDEARFRARAGQSRLPSGPYRDAAEAADAAAAEDAGDAADP